MGVLESEMVQLFSSQTKMKTFLFFLIILLSPFFPTLAENTNTLAPHPFYFTVDGSPSFKEIIVDGKIYLFGWDGKNPYLIKKVGGDVPYWRFIGKPPDKTYRLGFIGCFLPLFIGGWFWASITLYLTNCWVLLPYVFYPGLLVFLSSGFLLLYFSRKGK